MLDLKKTILVLLAFGQKLLQRFDGATGPDHSERSFSKRVFQQPQFEIITAPTILKSLYIFNHVRDSIEHTKGSCFQTG